MPESSIEALGLQDLEELEAAQEKLATEEAELGLEWTGRKGMNRAERRAKLRQLRRLTRRPEAIQTMTHPLTKQLTPYGKKLLAARRAKNRFAKQSRKRNQGQK